MKCTHAQEVVLIRAYGRKSELIIDRAAELVNFVTLSQVGLSPPLHARFANGFVYGYVPGKVCTPDDLRAPSTAALIAAQLAQWHKVHLPGGTPRVPLLVTLQRWLDGVPTHYANPDKQARFVQQIQRASLQAEIDELARILTVQQPPVVFCHNDLLAANIIMAPSGNAVHFIDFEYGCYNYRAFDIANHFCEWAGFDCDYARYPNIEQQHHWITCYYTAYYGQPPDDSVLKALLAETQLFVKASHLYWGLWGLVQAAFSDIDFDYLGYAIKRLAQLQCH